MGNLKPTIMILIMLMSILSGCTSSDTSSEIGELEQQITDLQQSNDNLTAELESTKGEYEFFNSLSSELQNSLTAANATVAELNLQIGQNEIIIDEITNLRDSLQIELDEAIISNSSAISELEANLDLLNQQISELSYDGDQLEDDLEDAMDEISDLTNSLTAITDQMSRIMYQTFTDVNGCPLSNPSQKIKIGHDNSDNGQLTGNEIEMIVGNCSGESGAVASIGNIGGSPRDAIISQAVQMNGVLYFTADDNVHGNELWRSDGTLGGTSMVIDLTPAMCSTCVNMDSDIRELVAGDSKLFFASSTMENGFPDPIRELFVSDGTESGTEMVMDLFNCPTSTGDITINYEGVNSLVVIPGSSYGTQGEDRVVFSGFSCSMENWVCYGEEPWISDGTLAGTIEVDNIRIGDTPMSTADGQGVLIDIIGSQPRSFFQSSGTIYFTADDNESGREVWKFDLIQTSSVGATLVKDIYVGASDSIEFEVETEFTQFETDIYFAANDGITGFELWKTNGSTSGTTLVRNVDLDSNSSDPKHLTVGGDGMLYFTANDGEHGYELWQSNGTWGGTNMFLDISPDSNSSNPRYLIEFANGIYFVANNGTKNIAMVLLNGYIYDLSSSWNGMINITNPKAAIVMGSDNSLYFTSNEGLFRVDIVDQLHPGIPGMPFTYLVDLDAVISNPEILVVVEGETGGEDILFLNNDVNNNRYLFYYWDNPYSSIHYI